MSSDPLHQYLNPRVCHPLITEPWRILKPDQTSGTYTLLGQQIHIMEVFLTSGETLNFRAWQSVMRQSSTPRLFVSKQPFGQPIPWARKEHVSLNLTPLAFSMADGETHPDTQRDTPVTWALAPGYWYINVRNMENFTNGWTIQFDDPIFDFHDFHNL